MTFTRDELDAKLKALIPALANYDATKFSDLRASAWKQTLAEYQKSLADSDHPFIRKDTLGLVTPPSTGTEILNTSVGDVFQIDLEADCQRIAGDTILVFIDATAEFNKVGRITLDTLEPSGVDATLLGFYENKGVINLYTKQGEFTAPADLHYDYYRRLDAEPATGATDLDILEEDFSTLVSNCAAFIRELLPA